MVSRLGLAFLVASFGTACAGSKPPEPSADAARGAHIELSELEIHAGGVDRFQQCPPVGDLGQAWIPARVSEAPHDPVVTERAIEQTLKPFRSCYTKGYMHQAPRDGRAAIVLRVGPSGKKAAVENYATCGLPLDVVRCLVAEASRVTVEAPTDGVRTVVIPAVFVPRTGYGPAMTTGHDGYAAAAYLVLEEGRPGLHACEQSASSKSVQAQGVFSLDIDARGRVLNPRADPWNGPPDLMACATGVLTKLVFPEPPAGGARILARIAFNPGTR